MLADILDLVAAFGENDFAGRRFKKHCFESAKV
jgi:hypothetical protein